MATPALTDPPITVTDGAARKIRQLATRDGREQALLRLRVVAGGCSGFSYELTFADDAALMGGGLRVRNPQAIHECACGDSFSI